jgi:hypothetical protein
MEGEDNSQQYNLPQSNINREQLTKSQAIKKNVDMTLLYEMMNQSIDNGK